MRIATGALRPRNDTVFYMGCGAGGRQAGASALTHCLPIEFVGGGVPAAPLTGRLYSTPPGTAAQSPGGTVFIICSVVFAGAAAIHPRPIYTACITHTRQTIGISGPSAAVGAFFAASGHAENHSDSDQKHRKFLNLHTLSPFSVS